MEFLTDNKIPVGRTARAVVDWMTDHLGWFFDGLATIMETLIDGLLAVMSWPHPLLVTLLFTALAFALRRSLAVLV